MDLSDSFLTEQIIAYIGNKRTLLPFLAEVFRELERENPVRLFLDPFAGSGSVSRLGKYLGYSVMSNDWEEYTRIINSCHIAMDRTAAEGLFRSRGGMKEAFRWFENEACHFTPYISEYYAPRSMEEADYRRERLFYTRENGLFIDRIRSLIEEEYPPDCDGDAKKERTLLIASLLYQAATHANTSGVFKAFHKGFGGHGRDALKRITQRMRLLLPVLIDGRGECGVFAEDAADFVSGFTADLCYLDPPYNQHQYGSNYHLLNTIARWDKPPCPLEFGESGRLTDKAGIRKDWVRTRSPFCYRERATAAFRELLDNIDSRFIVLSYNTEGIIPYEQLVDILCARGPVELFAKDYVKYRGGRQSLHRRTHNVEFLLVCRQGTPLPRANRKELYLFRQKTKLQMLFKQTYHPQRIKENFSLSGEKIRLSRRRDLSLRMRDFYLFEEPLPPETIDKLSGAEVEEMIAGLESCLFRDREEECLGLIRLMQGREDGSDFRFYRNKLMQALRKIAHKKYRQRFERVMAAASDFAVSLQAVSATARQGGDLLSRLEELRDLAARRFAG